MYTSLVRQPNYDRVSLLKYVGRHDSLSTHCGPACMRSMVNVQKRGSVLM